MSDHIYRSIQEPKREGLSWDELWRGLDKGLIACWEVGRDTGMKDTELAKRAKNGELPVLGWKGGVDKQIKKKEKFGTLNYFAMWQGLRGEDLNVEISKEIELVCTMTRMRVIYTDDAAKYGEQ